MINGAGILSFHRVFVPQQYIECIECDETKNALNATLKVPREVVELLENNKITITRAYEIESEICTKCTKDYFTCNCIKFLEDVHVEVKDCEPIGFIWTNRSAFVSK